MPVPIETCSQGQARSTDPIFSSARAEAQTSFSIVTGTGNRRSSSAFRARLCQPRLAESRTVPDAESTRPAMATPTPLTLPKKFLPRPRTWRRHPRCNGTRRRPSGGGRRPTRATAHFRPGTQLGRWYRPRRPRSTRLASRRPYETASLRRSTGSHCEARPDRARNPSCARPAPEPVTQHARDQQVRVEDHQIRHLAHRDGPALIIHPE